LVLELVQDLNEGDYDRKQQITVAAELTLGRLKKHKDGTINSGQVSGNHATVNADGHITDIGSTNGTYLYAVNDAKSHYGQSGKKSVAGTNGKILVGYKTIVINP
jgi:pSer/pThr/pTyr-binding forkhead associated (FHA) protein